MKLGKTRKGHFKTRYEPNVGGLKIPVDRGWTSVEARVGKRKFRFVNTHLEAFGDTKIRQAQAKELTKGPLKTKTQVVLVGDLNSGIARHNEPEKPGDDLAFKALKWLQGQRRPPVLLLPQPHRPTARCSITPSITCSPSRA